MAGGEQGQAFAAIGGVGTEIQRIQRPTPRVQNLPGRGVEIIHSDAAGIFRFAYPTGSVNSTLGWALETSTALDERVWDVIESGTNSGIERVHETALEPGQRRFYRVRLPQ